VERGHEVSCKVPELEVAPDFLPLAPLDEQEKLLLVLEDRVLGRADAARSEDEIPHDLAELE
jgi:hypothetical protein